MKEGTNVVVDWPRVYPPTRGKVISINKESETALVWCMGSKVEFPLKRLKYA